MLRRSWLAAAVTTALVGAAPAMADAQTLGTITPPAGASVVPCIPSQSAAFVQVASEPTIPFAAPAVGKITDWETNQSGGIAPGAQLGLVVVRPGASNSDSVVGVDLETLPATLPQDGIVKFQIAHPIQVQAGDMLGLWSPAVASPPLCAFTGVSVPSDLVAVLGPLSAVPAPGQSVPVNVGGPALVDVAATWVPNSEDAGVTATAGPPNALADHPALLSSTVTNNGPDSQPITFTDTVPAGLAIDSALAGSGTCTTAGQTVSCTITGLAAGQSTPVVIAVTPTASGAYQNPVSVSLPSGTPDPNAANDTASAVLSVAPVPVAPAAHCVVPSLSRIPSAFARRVLGLLGCRLGAVRRVHSKNVAKGEVIRSAPGAGTYAAGQAVALQVSSGPVKRKPKR